MVLRLQAQPGHPVRDQFVELLVLLTPVAELSLVNLPVTVLVKQLEDLLGPLLPCLPALALHLHLALYHHYIQYYHYHYH